MFFKNYQLSTYLGLIVINIYDLYHLYTYSDANPVDCTPSKRIILAKFGGSALTNKRVFESLNDEALQITAFQLQLIYSKGIPVVLVHGAGSFGHFQAKQYSLSTGGIQDENNENSENEIASWKHGLVITRRSVLKLNNYVTEALLQHHLPAISISLFPSLLTCGKNNLINDRNLFHQIFQLVHLGFLPILHGDVVLDQIQRCSIFGGDQILFQLCKTFKAHGTKDIVVVFLTDVAGVYDRPPTDPEAKLVPILEVNAPNSLDQSSSLQVKTDILSHDVTGGISEKLRVAIEIARLGINVYIVQVGTLSALEALSGNPPSIGTIIKLKNI